MCGIAGIIQFRSGPPNEQGREELLFRLKKMSYAIRHRGPDGENYWVAQDQSAGFAHRRLSILDLSPAAAQPMHLQQRFTIVFNGEIYNHVELREELIKKGYSFSTRSDTEILLAAFDCYREECPARLDGMFAFAIWDSLEKSLFMSRDRFGEKPLYYSINEKEFCFSSERKGLWAIGIDRKINYPLLLDYLVLGHTETAAEKTISFYEDIFLIPPAHYLYLQAGEGKFDLKSYWDCNKELQLSIDEEQAQEQFMELLTWSIRRRLRMDVKAGTSLSGGIDSSTIAALVVSQTNEKWDSFSAIFPGFVKDESAHIKKMVSTFRLASHQTTPTVDEFLRDFDRLCYHQEEPFSSSSIFAQFKVYELAATNHLKVLMDGQGADETLGGYSKYIHWYLQELVRKKFLQFTKEYTAFRKNEIEFQWGWKNYVAAFLPAQVPGILEKRAVGKVRQNKDLNREFIANYFDRPSIFKPLVLKLNDILYFDTCQSGLDSLLRYADRNSMAHGIELRLPFLSHELVEFIFSLPSSFKIHDGWTKWILRKSMDNILPPEITWRKDKTGFEPPQKVWMQDKRVIEKIRESKNILVREKILQPSVMDKKIQPQDAHAAENFDWRWLTAAAFFEKNLFV
jgi:asparagine synthase (glutamine-hydrolysing)